MPPAFFAPPSSGHIFFPPLIRLSTTSMLVSTQLITGRLHPFYKPPLMFCFPNSGHISCFSRPRHDVPLGPPPTNCCFPLLTFQLCVPNPPSQIASHLISSSKERLFLFNSCTTFGKSPSDPPKVGEHRI